MKRILVVDDDPDVRKILGVILTGAGYAITETGDGKEALRLHGQSPFDLVITDILMPEFDGIELILNFNQLRPRPKIIAISGGGARTPESVLNLAQPFGVVATFRKPFDWDAMLTAIRGSLNESQVATSESES